MEMKMSLEVKTVENKKFVPHLAVTHEAQGGPASKRSATLLMKSGVEITPEIATWLKSVTGEDIESNTDEVIKASQNMVREKLREAVNKFAVDKWDWVYMEDYDENYVIFSNNKGIFYVDYTINGVDVTLGNTAVAVNKVISYEATSGKLVMSDSLTGLDNSVHSLVVKSFDSISNNEKIKDIFKSKLERGIQMEVEIQKAVEQATAAQKQELEKATLELTKSQETIKELSTKLEGFEKAAVEARTAARLKSIKEFMADEAQAVELNKSLEALDETSFESVTKTMKAAAAKVEGSDLFSTVSKSSEEAVDTNVSKTEELLKAKFAPKQ
jgi:hypothetical protein